MGFLVTDLTTSTISTSSDDEESSELLLLLLLLLERLDEVSLLFSITTFLRLCQQNIILTLILDCGSYPVMYFQTGGLDACIEQQILEAAIFRKKNNAKLCLEHIK